MTGTPVVEGWFTTDPPRLIGTSCTACGTVSFPPQTMSCRNPGCDGSELVSAPLSRRGRVWSFADARYRPPPPYASGEEFTPYTIAAVELEAERIVVLGQLVPGIGVDDLEVGMEVELVIDDLDADHVMWKWTLPSTGSEPSTDPGPSTALPRGDRG